MNFEFKKDDWVAIEGGFEIRFQKEEQGHLITQVYEIEENGEKNVVLVPTRDLPNEIVIETNIPFNGTVVAR
ncbi:hypothetical protein [Chryseobacterium indoltheticum]|uniref:Uncharacterized protein n=1 Tax=Chryseobacterium indoltheticum TaxID=254 RepID=A0A381FH51_9FLAO|nr:hypothetical protein [Chryseobacterium indoltheticum]AZA74702.1 hypothetical protein EG358_13430 [Chryseobacterium indoltheticum]SIQ38138.1 hypothetical protein SAMN05421682_104289 [Chryseobacterium indoltheticum]SUX45851.1 Uncharacterised protein [Chryseobacterium indoltheticum]